MAQRLGPRNSHQDIRPVLYSAAPAPFAFPAPKTVAAKASRPPKKLPTEQECMNTCATSRAPKPPAPFPPRSDTLPEKHRGRENQAQSRRIDGSRARGPQLFRDRGRRPADRRENSAPTLTRTKCATVASKPAARASSVGRIEAPSRYAYLAYMRRIDFYRRASYLKSQHKIVER